MEITLIQRTIKKKNTDYKEVVNLLNRLFPKKELYPMWILMFIASFKKCKFISYYHDDEFIGISYTIEFKQIVHIKYLAVDDNIHSNGYGSKIIKILKENYNNKTMTLFIETVDENEVNYEQRVKRLNFYLKNGFSDIGISAMDKKPYVDILCTDSSYSLKQCKKMMRFIPMKVYKR